MNKNWIIILAAVAVKIVVIIAICQPKTPNQSLKNSDQASAKSLPTQVSFDNLHLNPTVK